MNKARFPGRSINKQKNPTVSFRDLSDTAGVSLEYKDAKARLMAELPALRDQFLEDGLEEFHGFSPNDKLHSACNKKRAELTAIVSKLENQDHSVKGKVNGFNTSKGEPSARGKSKRIADRSSTGLTKRKYPFESPEETQIAKEMKTVVVETNDPFKTPLKVKVNESPPLVEEREKKLPVVAAVTKTEAETLPKKRKEVNTTATTSMTRQSTSSATTSPRITNDFFQEKEDYVASVIVLTDSRLNQNYESLRQVRGLIHCGVCLSIAECDNLGPQRKNGAFLCLKCIEFLKKMIKIAKNAEAFRCEAKGACEIASGTEYCQACFVRSCLLLLDLTDDLYFKMWRSVPTIARNYVPTKPPMLKRYPNRGKVLYVNVEDGSIIRICPFKNSRPEKSENSNGVSAQTNGNSKGVKRLFPNDDASLSKVTGPRVKQVSRRVSERPPRATFGDAIEIMGQKSEVGEPNKEMLLDRLEIEKKMIKVLCPLESYEVERYGYPIAVPEGEEDPTKPLCFACGSAGIKQLIFCSACCEPFHPYCADDALLLSAFIVQSVKETKEEDIIIKINDCKCTANCQNPCSSCTPALRMFRRWKCMHCIRCKSCNKGTNSFITGKENEFLKCIQCHDSYHFNCVKKMTCVSVKANDIDKWMCQNCLKCTSCGVRLSKSFQNNFRKLSTDDNGNCLDREMLCLDCFKRRQKGSFCPICLVCYDDNDWDSKMMECDRCGKWIHSKCEGLNDEQYFILSSLPETVVYICRLCVGPENEVGWRQAVKADLTDGCTKALDIFQKKAVGMSRKRRALTFDEEVQAPYFNPTIKAEENETLAGIEIETIDIAIRIVTEANAQSEKPIPIPDVKDEDVEIFKKFSCKPCAVILYDMDTTKRVSPIPSNDRKMRSSGGIQFKDKVEPFPKQVYGEITPVKVSPALTLSPDNKKNIPIETTPTKISTPTRIVTSFTDSIRSMGTFWTSVADFHRVCLKLLPNYFLEMDNNSTVRFEEYFEEAVKQVFPWFKISEFNEISCNTSSSSDVELNTDVKRESSPMLTTTEPIGEDEITSESNVFEEVFWDPDYFMDYRECLFCGELGDFPPNSCGRLLYVGPAEWVHVNCAIWSSEVWEEETGALQQVEAALGRGKKNSCDFCGNTGASLNCCAGTCRRCYHFLCAQEAGCSLLEDKTVFCPGHETTARGQLQSDMHVMRKVFVDLDLSRKKDMRFASTDIKVFIGSMRIDRLGQLFPISVLETDSFKFLVPVGYKCGRLFWSLPTPKKLDLCWLETSIKRDGDFRTSSDIQHTDESYNVVIDHGKRTDWVQSKKIATQDFFNWINSAPRFIDEYNIEWLLPYHSSSNGKILRTPIRKNGFKKEKVNGEKIRIFPLEAKAVSCPVVVNRAKIEWEVKGFTFTGRVPEYGIGKPCRCYVSDKMHFPSGIFTTSPEESLFFTEGSDKPNRKSFIKKIGLFHPGIRFLMEQLPGVEHVAGNYEFGFHNPIVSPEDTPVKLNASGCARTEGFVHRKPFDMFGWLASRHRKAPPPLRMYEETVKSKGLPIAMRYRNLKERAIKDLVVLPSHIHGRGLFARRDIEMGEMLIEYAGEAIRSPVCDVRERMYENGGMGCYMFRIDRDLVIDATMKGNAARFINHSCDPNCESKSVKILGKGHILIFALKNIGRGEELTYDYKFEREADKLPCSCSSKKCRKFLN